MKNIGVGRRDFLKIGTAVTVAGAAIIPSKLKGEIADKIADSFVDNAIIHDDFPNEVRSDYMPHTSKDNMFIGAPFHPEDKIAQKLFYGEDENEDDERDSVEERDTERPGYDRIADSMGRGAWALHDEITPMSCFAVNNQGVFKWSQGGEVEEMPNENERAEEGAEESGVERDEERMSRPPYKFKSKEEASNIIKRAARIYGADLVGIAHRDKRWDYSEFVDGDLMMQGKLDDCTYGWERFPFEPKTVIVMAFEEDYEAISTAPAGISGIAVGQGYSQMTKVAFQLSVFLKELGYKSVAAGNDMGISVPYAIAAGLGEGSRMGLLVTYKYGPRVRIAKVYTDLDFVEYDKPLTFGVMKFCEKCMRCADACPTKALSRQEEPTFEPTEGENRWFNAIGVKKYWIDARKCSEGWNLVGSDCGSCVAVCPYNKPDFWHHRLTDKIASKLPGPTHTLMKDMDKLFGYGELDDPNRIKRFFNPKGKSYNGH